MKRHKKKMAPISALIFDIESDDNTNSEHMLHRILEIAVSITGRGEVGDDYTKTIEFPIGNATIVSDPYYGRIWIDTDDGEEEVESEKEILALFEEVKDRIQEFDRQIKETREKISGKIFDKPLRLARK